MKKKIIIIQEFKVCLLLASLKFIVAIAVIIIFNCFSFKNLLIKIIIIDQIIITANFIDLHLIITTTVMAVIVLTFIVIIIFS